jgi:hypothetical protein
MIPFAKSLLFEADRFLAVLGVVGSTALGTLEDSAPFWLKVAVPIVIALSPAAHKKVVKS